MSWDRGPGLVESSSWIARYTGHRVVVKLGGELLDGPAVLERIALQLAVLQRCGLRPVLVHGGGVQVDRSCRARDVSFEKVAGRRITSPEILEVLVDVVGGSLNRFIVSTLERHGVPAQGFEHGVTGAIRCRRRPPTRLDDGRVIDWGAVGDVISIDTDRLEAGNPDAIPVIPSLGTLDDGSFVNVNADTVASGVALGLGAAKILFLTGVAGVMADINDAGPISELSPAETRQLLAGDAVRGGMKAKLEEALRAIAGGVPRVHILSGRAPWTLLHEIFTDDGCGTLVVDRQRES